MLNGPYLFNATEYDSLYSGFVYLLSRLKSDVQLPRIQANGSVASFCLLRFTSTSRLDLIKAIN